MAFGAKFEKLNQRQIDLETEELKLLQEEKKNWFYCIKPKE
jgi:hypothetical protein